MYALSPHDLEGWWPEVSRRTIGGLRARGVPLDVAEEAVQEAAARALRRRPDVRSVEELTRWTFRVARNVVIDRGRRQLRLVPVDETPEPEPTPAAGTEGAVIARLDLARTARALGTLRAADQEAIVAAMVEDPVPGRSRRDVVRDAVRLHRARKRLADAMVKVGACAAVGWNQLRRVVSSAGNAPAWVPSAVAAAMLVTSPGGEVSPESAKAPSKAATASSVLVPDPLSQAAPPDVVASGDRSSAPPPSPPPPAVPRAAERVAPALRASVPDQAPVLIDVPTTDTRTKSSERSEGNLVELDDLVSIRPLPDPRRSLPLGGDAH